MKNDTTRETAELLSLTGCDEFSSRTPVLRLGIALPKLKQGFAANAPPSRKRKEGAVAVWLILILVITVTGTYWATDQLCGVLAQRMQEMQRQRYRQQVAYPELWKQGRHW